MHASSSFRLTSLPVVLLISASALRSTAQQPALVAPSKMPVIATVAVRFQSYNVEMVEVTGGRFWKPYSSKDGVPPKASNGNAPTGIDPNLFEYRPPIDLSNSRLRKLAAALGPAYVRVSGTWQNTTYFQDSDAPAPATPPTGFNGVLTRAEWKGVVDFAHATDSQIVTSFATSGGTRDEKGLWTAAQASRFLAFTKSIGGSIAAAEFMNEPNMPTAAGTPATYDATAFGRDIAVFVPFLKKASPDTVILGAGSVGEGFPMLPPGMKFIKTEDMLAATGPVFDAISYHFYGGVSTRCSAAFGASIGTTSAAALSEDWLSRTSSVESFYAGLRDRFEPGKKMWLTETGQTACGGDSWASTYIDTFRYLNQLGALAQRNVQVVAHNTLAASDYALLENGTFRPRPDYWSALLWHKLMGTKVLSPELPATPGVHTYAHCLRNVPGGVALLVINADKDTPFTLIVPQSAERYTLSASDLLASNIDLNGTPLQLGLGDTLPALSGKSVARGSILFAPATITFLAFPNAKNSSCR